jgi:hypothetical protein
MKHLKRILILLVLTFVLGLNSFGQVHFRIIEMMDTATINQQLDFIEDKTNIYNGFRAIHEDVFQKLSKNTIDTVRRNRADIIELTRFVSERNNTIDSLNLALQESQGNLTQAIDTKDSLVFLGIEMDKAFYNSIVWSVIFALIILLVLGSFLFKRNLSTTYSTRKDLDQIKGEFEEYRRTSRERHEQLVINHFNEIKKLEEGGR